MEMYIIKLVPFLWTQNQESIFSGSLCILKKIMTSTIRSEMKNKYFKTPENHQGTVECKRSTPKG